MGTETETMSPNRAAALLALSLLAAGCANFSAIAPGTPAAQVEHTFGAPAAVWKNADGSEQWEYPLGPFGVQTFMITMADGAVKEVRQVLSDEYAFKVRPGMSKEDILRMLGRPYEVVAFNRRNEEDWAWRYRDEAVRTMILHVVFDRATGEVKTSFRIDETETDHGR